MRVIKSMNFFQKLDWVTWNWFAGCKKNGTTMFILGIVMCPLCIPFGMCLPFYMTSANGCRPPDRFFVETKYANYKQ